MLAHIGLLCIIQILIQILYKSIFRIQANNSIMSGYFCVGLTDYTSFFAPYDFRKKENVILSYFKNE